MSHIIDSDHGKLSSEITLIEETPTYICNTVLQSCE